MSEKERFCNVCGVKLVLGENWYESIKKSHNYVCKKCINARSAQWQSKNREKRNENHRNSRYKHGVKPMSENRECAPFLGVYVAERVLANTFKDVKVMPYANPGYDFVCNKGKKIDVKSACISKQGNWMFTISKNKIADYFLCIAFDNRKNVNPLHIWLLPSDLVSDKIGTRISPSTIDKWDEYKLDITKTVRCCNKMKEIDI